MFNNVILYHYTINSYNDYIYICRAWFLDINLLPLCHFIQVHVVLSNVGNPGNSVDLNGDYSSEDNDTDISDTDDEDEWDGAVTQV